MEKIPQDQNVEKKIGMGERIVNAIKRGDFDLKEVMGGENAQEEELNLIINKIGSLDPKDPDSYELHSEFVKLSGYDKNVPSDVPERKKISASIRRIIDNIFLK